MTTQAPEDTMTDLDKIRGQLAEFYSAMEAEKWLVSPHELLGGKSAIEMIRAGKSDEVFCLLDQLRSGAHV